jgi:predicted SAM-dependent methyltransferase
MSATSETSNCRERLAAFCTGYGLDVGFGGDCIVPKAIAMDMPKPYTQVGERPVQLGGSCERLEWFKDGVLNFIFSSHLIEDFSYEDQIKILKEWLRVIKPDGKIVLYQPDEQVYRKHCQETGQGYNHNHKEADYSLAAFKAKVLPHLSYPVKILHEAPAVEAYSWEIVLQKGRI